MVADIYQQIQQFYDESSPLWEQVWGEHMHHGFYGMDGSLRKERRQAQIDLIQEILTWAGVETVEQVLDVGCGIGGSTLYLAQQFNAIATGITLSPVQARRATQRAQEANLFVGKPAARFLVANALEMPFEDASFDLIWSLESGEHMPDKTQFLKECYRVLKPGGKLIFVTWCHRPITDAPLTAAEQHHLSEIYRVYCLPYVISLPEYAAIAQAVGFQSIHTADWSTAVAPFWETVMDSVWEWQAIVGLLRTGWKTIQAALALNLMRDGYRSGLVRFGLLTATRH
ncbi:MAG TPA: methyltransferase domain-containing protein [Leptolyngbyaceae cyanobacterium M33_DOE_097]|uniref:Methyltransferase domain-containing protein n=1 Tax=Oscillatoriales cyanobacterium SpSt-418 TaxID=2282169 RepID=A0A7C3PAI6_9CYAN|nr:methyltransferase domain-containing protein [Leptolyngbyaceae cyanobacterium M33_DOE_097]